MVPSAFFQLHAVTGTFEKVFEFCRGRLEEARRRSPWYASLHSCVATLEHEHAAHDETLDTSKALKQREGLGRTQTAFKRFSSGRLPLVFKFPSQLAS